MDFIKQQAGKYIQEKLTGDDDTDRPQHTQQQQDGVEAATAAAAVVAAMAVRPGVWAAERLWQRPGPGL
jgi:hypothetical protein